MIETKGKFYLGRLYDLKKAQVTEQPLLYEADDLTTHAVVVGMTGSGKTGLCVNLLEEAALNNIPALMIDPKGDVTNTLLHFPELLPQDFQPWVNPDEARREGLSLAQAAEKAANQWREGLAKWDIQPERLQALREAAQFAVYTPGSDAGLPVSILASLKAPEISWEANRELLREKISGTVTAILGLVGVKDIDPVRSREHILLANIFEHTWSQAKDLNLGELILKTQNPPFDKLGVFDVNTFYPEKERFELAMMLNNILAAPAFQTWIEGQPLEIGSLLYTPDGRPRHSVFYLAHLNDAERMFFVTLLYTAVESWMRVQSGTTSLRAIVYFDEIFGYLPPVANPPSKQFILRMLKQARAFGIGQVLVTQNPVDLDYKALSNAGSWFIGKLQTDQDKQRLLDGLEGAMAGAMNRSRYDAIISALGKRVFLLHNVHEKEPQVFQTRWAMNYLAGPLTRTHIPMLNQLVGATQETAAVDVEGPLPPKPSSEKPRPSVTLSGTSTRPALPAGIAEYFLPNNVSFAQALKKAAKEGLSQAKPSGMMYHPALLAQARVRYVQLKYNLDFETVHTALVHTAERRGIIRWSDFLAAPIDPESLEDEPLPEARFASLPAILTQAASLKTLERQFLDWAFQNSPIKIKANEALKLYASPDMTTAEFHTLCSEAADKAFREESKKFEKDFEKQLRTLQTKLEREERELAEDESEYSQRKLEEMGTHAENILGLIGGRRRRLTTSLTKRRMTAKAKADIDESVAEIKRLKTQIAELEAEKNHALEEARARWGEAAGSFVEITLTPYKKDVLLELFGVAWVPYYQAQIGQETLEFPGYQTP